MFHFDAKKETYEKLFSHIKSKMNSLTTKKNKKKYTKIGIEIGGNLLAGSEEVVKHFQFKYLIKNVWLLIIIPYLQHFDGLNDVLENAYGRSGIFDLMVGSDEVRFFSHNFAFLYKSLMCINIFLGTSLDQCS